MRNLFLIFLLAFVISCTQIKEMWDALPNFDVEQDEKPVLGKDCWLDKETGREKCKITLPSEK